MLFILVIVLGCMRCGGVCIISIFLNLRFFVCLIVLNLIVLIGVLLYFLSWMIGMFVVFSVWVVLWVC